jgi:hypothetical protein
MFRFATSSGQIPHKRAASVARAPHVLVQARSASKSKEKEMLSLSTAARGLAGALCILVLTACGGGGEEKNLGGTLSGLNAGSSVTLKNNNDGDTITLSQNGPFKFPTFVAMGTSYTVIVVTQPAGQNCTVANGTGMMNAGSVNNIQVTCA